MPREKIPLTNTNGRNDRFTYSKIYDGEQWLFLKSAQSPELEQNLQREVVWADFVNHIARIDPSARIRSPRITGFDENGGLLMEYIEAPLVAPSDDVAIWKSKIDRYAQTLNVLDKHAENYTVDWPTNEMASIKNIERTWRHWFGERYEESLPILTKAHEIIAASERNLDYRVQHGDLTPWQMFEQNDKWIIYDGEKSGDHLPRYNDLAYGYGRLFTRLNSRETATALLERFLVHSGVDSATFFRGFLPIMTFRATGMLADAYNDHTENYVHRAHELLDMCFDGEPQAFLPSA